MATSSEILTAVKVLDIIKPESIDDILLQLRDDATKLDAEIQEMISSLSELLDDNNNFVRAEVLSQQIDDSIRALEEIRSRDGVANHPKHWMTSTLDFINSLRAGMCRLQSDMLSTKEQLTDTATRYYLIWVPFQRDLSQPTHHEQLNYVREIILDGVGVGPVLGETPTLVSIANTIQELSNYELRFGESVERVKRVLSFWCMIEYLKEEGLMGMKVAATKRAIDVRNYASVLDALDGELRAILAPASSRHPEIQELLTQWNTYSWR